MKIIHKMPKRHQPVLDYMKSIKPVQDIMISLSNAVQSLAEGSNDFAREVRGNKAFDGHHETEALQKFLRRKRKLRLRVQRGYIVMEQGDPATVLRRHLDKSDHFHMAFVSTKSLTDGYQFVINRDGTLQSGMSSASSFVTSW